MFGLLMTLWLVLDVRRGGVLGALMISSASVVISGVALMLRPSTSLLHYCVGGFLYVVVVGIGLGLVRHRKLKMVSEQ